MTLKLSEIESEIFQCKVARFETDLLKTCDFQQQLIDQSIDFCRLKLDSADLGNYAAIAQLSMPYQFCGSILKYSMDFFDLPKPKHKQKNINFELYNPSSQQEILSRLIEDTFIIDPIGYYKNNLLFEITTKQKEALCMAKWYVQYCDLEKNKMILMKLDEEYIGYISIFQTAEDTVNTPVAGVLPKFQKQNMFFELRTYRHLYCLENNIQYGTAGARIENNLSQQTFISDGQQQTGNESIYIITPFLGEHFREFNFKTRGTLSDTKILEILNLEKDTELLCYSKRSLLLNKDDITSCKITAPINTSNKKLIVIKYLNSNGGLCLINWLEN